MHTVRLHRSARLLILPAILPALLLGACASPASHTGPSATLAGASAAQADAIPAPAAVLAAMERVADWQLAHPSLHGLDEWTQGVGDAGFMALSNLAGTHKYRDAMVAMGEK